MVGRDATVAVLQPLNERPVIKRPSGIAMKKKEGFSVPFVKVVISMWFEVEIVRRVGIDSPEHIPVGHHSMPSIRQFSPLPIPSKATLSPDLMRPSSAPSARADGSEAAPVFPRNSKVEKSFSRSKPRVL